MNKYGSTAMVIGAAEGLGRAFAERLASQRYNLLLVDSQQDPMELLATILERTNNVEVATIHADMRDESSIALLTKALGDHGCRLLIYNAATSIVGPFEKLSHSELDAHIDVNIRSLAHMAHGFCRLWRDSDPSGILMVSSLAGYRGSPLVSAYAATKAYIWNLAESLSLEYAKSQMDISVLMPGPTSTPGYWASKPSPPRIVPKPMAPEVVARIGLDHLGKKTRIVPGFANRFSTWLMEHLLPRKLALRLHASALRSMYPDKQDTKG